MLPSDFLRCLLPLAVSVHGYVVSTQVEHPTSTELSVSRSSFSSDFSNIAVGELNSTNLQEISTRTCGGLDCYESYTTSSGPTKTALAARGIRMKKRQSTTSSDPCGANPCSSSTTTSSDPCGANPCSSSTTSSASCSSSDPCPKDTTETETHLATVTMQTTEMQTAYITDHITTTQHTIRMFTKIVNVAQTVTSTSTVTGCSTFTTVVTTIGSTTTITSMHSAPTSTSSSCGSADCTVTTTVSTDKDMPTTTTSAGTAEVSGHDVVEVISEEEMKELMARKKKKKQETAEKKKDIADKKLQQNGAGKNAAKLVARHSIRSDRESSAVGSLTKPSSVTAVTSPPFGTTVMTIKLPLNTFTITLTTTQGPHTRGKARSEGSETEMVNRAVSTTRTALSSMPENAAESAARQDMQVGSKFSTARGLIKGANVDAVTPPALNTTLTTILSRVPRDTEATDTKTITQSASFSTGKTSVDGSEAGTVDSATSTALTARSSLLCITLRSQGAHSTICPHSSCWNGDC